MPLYDNIRQERPAYCGISALATVASNYGFAYDARRLASLAGTDESGTSLAGLRGAAESLPFSAQNLALTFDQLQRTPLPAIAALRFNGPDHYVVVHKHTHQGVVVADPAGHVEVWSRERLCNRWCGADESGWALVLVPNLGRCLRNGYCDQLRGIWSLLRLYSSTLWMSCALALFTAVLGVATLGAVRLLLDAIGRNALSELNAAAGLMAVLSGFEYALRRYQATATNRFTQRVSKLFRAQLMWQAGQQSDRRSRARDSVEQCKSIREVSRTSTELLRVVADSAGALLLLAALWFIAWPVALVVTLIPMSVIPAAILLRSRKPATPRPDPTGPALATVMRLTAVTLVWSGAQIGVVQGVEFSHLVLGLLVLAQLRGPVVRILALQDEFPRASHALNHLIARATAGAAEDRERSSRVRLSNESLFDRSGDGTFLKESL